MKTYNNPSLNQWKELSSRPTFENNNLNELVESIFSDVKKEGDKALKKYSLKFDKIAPEILSVDQKEIAKSVKKIKASLIDAIKTAEKNITKFHKAQFEKINKIETTKGVTCWRESRAIESVGIYIPGGTAPLFSTVLMLAIPAKLAGCREIILCTPPDKNGNINPAILATAQILGIKKIYKLGGIQAIAAMTLGTETIPAVNKIFGPGNQYVTAAKQFAQNFGIAIDMPAGPSEVLVIADEKADPDFIAADLLSQAEHGADSQVIFLTTNQKIIDKVLISLQNQLQKLPRKDVAAKALDNSKAILFSDIETCIQFSNFYAPEHLILALKDSKKWTSKITNAGSVFLGNYSCESAGDYASGTNHTLPTNGYAKNYSGVSLDSFIRKITFQEITKAGIQKLGPVIEEMAEAEELFAHKNAVTIRLKKLKNKN